MKNAQTIIINGQAISGDIATLRAILGITEENVVEAHKAETPKAKAPKAPKAKTPKAETPKTEEPKAEFAYTSGGAIIQYADKHTLKANNLRRVNNAIDKLVKAGFCASWKRIGGWVYLYHTKKADNKTMAEFEAATLAKGWEFSKKHNAWIDKTMLADYADNFKA